MSGKIERAINGSLQYPRGYGSALKNKPLSDEGKYVTGLDIEADYKTAEPYILAFSNDQQDGYIETNNYKQVMKFLMTDRFKHTINFFHNIQYDFTGLLKLFPQEVSTMIYGYHRAYFDANMELQLDKANAEYSLHYIDKKAFHIKKFGERKYSYYDTLQYYQMSLKSCAKQYLNDDKEEFNAAESSIKKFKEDAEYREKAIDYCKHDAYLCKELGKILVSGVNKFVNTKNFNSSASVSEYYFRSNDIVCPKIPESMFKKFLKAYYGGRFEITRKGFIENISMYDIKSAYPFAMSKMPILSKNPICKNIWRKSEHALYGSYEITAKMPDEYLGLLPVREKVLYFPTGKFSKYWVDKITLDKIESLGIPYQFHSGIEIYDNNVDYRLSPLILKLYNIKEDSKNPEVVRMAAKIILNSLYGKFIQLIDDTTLELVEEIERLDEINAIDLFSVFDKYYEKIHTNNFNVGKLFAPQYASFITSHTRLQLFDVALKCGMDSIVGFHTDSIILQNKTLETGNKLGDFEVEQIKVKDPDTGKVVKKVPIINGSVKLLKSGFYDCEKDGHSKIRSRGIGKTDSILQDKFTVKRRFGLNQAVRRDFNQMNVISERDPYDNDISLELKRNWEGQLTIKDVREGRWIDSKPKVLLG